MQNYMKIIREALGIDYNFMHVVYMGLRALVLYAATILLIKFNKKLMGTRTPANFLLFIMLGSLSAVAIVGDAPFLPVLIIIALLVTFNLIVATIIFYVPVIEHFIIGKPDLIVKDGNIQWKTMRKYLITRTDLMNALNDRLNTNDLSKISAAYFAIDGTINFIINNHKD